MDGLTNSAEADIARAEHLVWQALAATPRNPLAGIVTLNSRVQHGAEGSPGHRSCFALGACLLAPDFKSVRPDRAMGMGYKVMSTWVEVAVDE